MKAKPGDWLVIKGTVVDAPEQVGQILEVHSADGSPPYLVRWTRDDHEALVFPGPDAHVLTASAKQTADEQRRKRFIELQELISRSHPPGGRGHDPSSPRPVSAASAK